MCMLLLGTHWWYPKDAFLARYDFLTLAALGIQAVLLALRMETWSEAPRDPDVPCGGHLHGALQDRGRLMDLSRGQRAAHRRRAVVHRVSCTRPSWVATWPACGGLFDFRFRAHPPLAATAALSVLIYVNFFAHHFIMDFRWLLFALTVVLFARTWVYFPHLAGLPAHAAAAGFRAGGALHLVRREHRHLCQRLALSKPGPGLATGCPSPSSAPGSC